MAEVRDVRVVNTTAEPLPVQAQQSGTWSVGINGVPTVSIDAANNTIKIDPANNTVKIGGGTKLAFNESFIGMPTSGKNVGPIDISAFAQIRFSVTVNGSGSIQFYLLSGWGGQSFNGWQLDHFTVDLDPGTFTRTYDVAGATLLIQMIPSNSDNQAIIGVFGN
jgi:hypothetical protein